MGPGGLFDELREAFMDFDLERAKEVVKRALESGIEPEEVVEKGLRPVMEEVGRKYEKGEFFLAELILAGEMFKEIMDELLAPAIRQRRRGLGKLGTVVIGTVRGDLHDIGKNIVATMLEAAGFEVIDLGADVPPEEFVEAIRKRGADIVAMSALLTTTMSEMKNVIEALKAAGLRDRVKVVVGGAPVSEEFAKEIGADAYGENAIEAVRICKELLKRRTF